MIVGLQVKLHTIPKTIRIKPTMEIFSNEVTFSEMIFTPSEATSVEVVVLYGWSEDTLYAVILSEYL